MEDFKHILLFKTNISCDTDKQLLHQLFDHNAAIKCWTIDLEDTDCVLRIVSETLRHGQIIELINTHGFECCELT